MRHGRPDQGLIFYIFGTDLWRRVMNANLQKYVAIPWSMYFILAGGVKVNARVIGGRWDGRETQPEKKKIVESSSTT